MRSGNCNEHRNCSREEPCELHGLLLLVPVLTQAFFTLVRGHFMSFTLFSARHILFLICLLNPYVIFNLIYKGLGRFKGRNIMSGNNQGSVL